MPDIPGIQYQTWLTDRNPDEIKDTNQLMSWTYLTFANVLQELIRTLGKRMEKLGAKMAQAGEFMKEMNSAEATLANDTTAHIFQKDSNKSVLEARVKVYTDAGVGASQLLINGPHEPGAYYQIYTYKPNLKTMAENLQTTITNDSSVSQSLQLLLSQLNSRFTTAMENVAKSTKNYENSADAGAANIRG